MLAIGNKIKVKTKTVEYLCFHRTKMILNAYIKMDYRDVWMHMKQI